MRRRFKIPALHAPISYRNLKIDFLCSKSFFYVALDDSGMIQGCHLPESTSAFLTPRGSFGRNQSFSGQPYRLLFFTSCVVIPASSQASSSSIRAPLYSTQTFLRMFL